MRRIIFQEPNAFNCMPGLRSHDTIGAINVIHITTFETDRGKRTFPYQFQKHIRKMCEMNKRCTQKDIIDYIWGDNAKNCPYIEEINRPYYWTADMIQKITFRPYCESDMEGWAISMPIPHKAEKRFLLKGDVYLKKEDVVEAIGRYVCRGGGNLGSSCVNIALRPGVNIQLETRNLTTEELFACFYDVIHQMEICKHSNVLRFSYGTEQIQEMMKK